MVGLGLVGAGFFLRIRAENRAPGGPAPTLHGHLHDVFPRGSLAAAPAIARYLSEPATLVDGRRCSTICSITLRDQASRHPHRLPDTTVWLAELLWLIHRVWVRDQGFSSHLVYLRSSTSSEVRPA